MIELAPEQLAELAELVAARLRGVLADQPTPSTTTGINGALVDARALADALGCSREFVYRHADELGGHRVGDGPRGRLRFDLTAALSAWNRPAEPLADVKRVSRSRRSSVSSVPLLQIRGEQ
jgi:hypothetical protein